LGKTIEAGLIFPDLPRRPGNEGGRSC
jgi:hypothetical protein